MAKHVRRVGVHTYRAHRLEVVDDGGTGWTVTIYGLGTASDDRPAMRGVRLRNAVPNGLPMLIEEAKQQVDRALDGPHWMREP